LIVERGVIRFVAVPSITFTRKVVLFAEPEVAGENFNNVILIFILFVDEFVNLPVAPIVSNNNASNMIRSYDTSLNILFGGAPNKIITPLERRRARYSL
jgi:hypothetical protein